MELNKTQPKNQKWKILIAVFLTCVIALSLYTLFAQFNSDYLSMDMLLLSAEQDVHYYEWDSAGNRYELDAVYGEDGYLLELSGWSSSGTDTETEQSKLRVGSSQILQSQITDPILSLNTGGGACMVFLDNELVYSDFPGATASLDSLPDISDGINEVYDSAPRAISFSLPADYTEKTLTVVETIDAANAEFWSPLMAYISDPWSTQLSEIVVLAPPAILTGLFVALLIVLCVLFIWQLMNGGQPWLLLLPIAVMLIQTLSSGGFMSKYIELPTNRILGLFYAFSVYIAGDLLIGFLGMKMKRRPRFVMLAVAAVHVLITIVLLSKKMISGEFLFLDASWLSGLGFAAFVLAVALMIWESRSNRYFKFAIPGTVVFVFGYAALMLIYRFTNYAQFTEMKAPLSSASSFYFYALNERLTVFMMFIVTVFSISEYVRETVEHRTRLATLEQINRLKTEFLGNVSHELKTPLTVMSSYAQLSGKALSENPESGELQSHMRLIESEADRLSLMVSQILDVSRIEENRMIISTRPCSLEEIVRKAVENYYPAFSKNNNRLLFPPSEQFPTVVCDSDRITQVIVNLISNASHHTQRGEIKIKISESEGFGAVEISDTGEGMTAEQLAHLFERYYTNGEYNKKSGTGTGLGLFICQHIIHEHGGKITVESEKGKGTVVKFTLPIQK